MTLKRHNAPWYANRVVLWLNGSVVNKDLSFKAKTKAKAKDLAFKAKAKDLTLKAKFKDCFRQGCFWMLNLIVILIK